MRWLVFLGSLLLGASSTFAAEKPNVLLIAVDDLRPWLGCYEENLKVSPNIDRLAAGGRVFQRHYVQVPTCGASRCALLFGRKPGHFPADTGNDAIKATAAKQPLPSLPALFRQNGYHTVAVGKISHYPGGRSGKEWVDGPEELPGAWDACHIPTGPWPSPEAAMHGYAGGKGREKEKSPVIESTEGDDKTYPDGWIVEEAIARLKDSASQDKPFFLAVGFIKPHLPFAAPASYFQQTRTASPTPSPTTKPSFPSTWHNSGEYRRYTPSQGDVFSSQDAALETKRAYLACVRYTDAQVGKLLEALDASPAGKNTIVVLWGDHGWLLGEHGIWGKHCLFEEALRSPLIIRTPDQKQPGAKSQALVETIDLYPTLTALAGIPTPAAAEGQSLLPILTDASASSDGTAVAAFGKSLTLRNDRYRLIISRKEPSEAELYDHQNDPFEQNNLATKQPDVVASMRETLTRLLPPTTK